MEHEVINYLRRLLSSMPSYGNVFSVVNIDVLTTGTTMVIDLDDGTTIRLDVERYTR